ncbi:MULTISPECIES: hypothetical protein [Flavobacterium]|nr:MULTISPECIES: hypothetical protein [Flavobacterium]
MSVAIVLVSAISLYPESKSRTVIEALKNYPDPKAKSSATAKSLKFQARK